MREDILALDIASCTGWCFGAPGGKPTYGSQKLAPEGASTAERGAAMIRWLTPMIQGMRPRTLVFEAPLAPSSMAGKTTANTARVLLGLPLVVESVAYLLGVWDIWEANVQDVRQHFIGRRTVVGAKLADGKRKPGAAKPLVIARCIELGYMPADDNAADAVALWSYACAIRKPSTGTTTTPLFGGAS